MRIRSKQPLEPTTPLGGSNVPTQDSTRVEAVADRGRENANALPEATPPQSQATVSTKPLPSGERRRLSPVERAALKPKSLRRAVTAKCWDCCGGGLDSNTRWTISECMVLSCPLHPVRPYQKGLVRRGKSKQSVPGEA